MLVSVVASGLLFHFFVQKWVEIIRQACRSVDFLKDQDVIRIVLNILQKIFSDNIRQPTQMLNIQHRHSARNCP
ncbi:hypothetical protein CsSME_00054089 [Camellia sinensis var. sinensis]